MKTFVVIIVKEVFLHNGALKVFGYLLLAWSTGLKRSLSVTHVTRGMALQNSETLYFINKCRVSKMEFLANAVTSDCDLIAPYLLQHVKEETSSFRLRPSGPSKLKREQSYGQNNFRTLRRYISLINVAFPKWSFSQTL